MQFEGLQITPSGITPSKSILEVILSFPIPKTLTDARSWFGLVNQVAWAYSLDPVMLSFCELVKRDSHFIWNKSLEDAFEHSKKVVINLVQKDISTLEKDQATCLAPDWSKEGIGFLLLQRYCSCTINKAPVCCPEGWCLIFASGRFCIYAKHRYAPIKDEAAAITWALEKCCMLVMGFPNLIVITDHKPLKELFGDRDLSKIQNP